MADTHDDKSKLTPPPEAGVPSDPVLDAHDTEPPGAELISIKAGHEPDRFKVKTILYVPAIMVIFVLTAFGVVTATFNYLTVKPPIDPAANPLGAKEGAEPMNERFARISSTDPNAAVPQPRLEYLKQTANPYDKNDPPFYRSKRPIPAEGATWELYPEDLRPQNFVDPTKHTKVLVNAGWVGDKKQAAHIPIAEAMKVVVDGKKLAVKPGAKPLPLTSVGRPDLSDSGRGDQHRLAVPGIILDRTVEKGDAPPPGH